MGFVGPEGPNVRADDAWGVVHDSYIFASGLGINPEVSTIRTISESVTLRSSLNTPASVCWSNYWGHQCGGRMVLRHLNPTCWGPWVADTWWILGGESANCPIYVLDYGHCSLPDLAAKGNCLWRNSYCIFIVISSLDCPSPVRIGLAFHQGRDCRFRHGWVCGCTMDILILWKLGSQIQLKRSQSSRIFLFCWRSLMMNVIFMMRRPLNQA